MPTMILPSFPAESKTGLKAILAPNMFRAREKGLTSGATSSLENQINWATTIDIDEVEVATQFLS